MGELRTPRRVEKHPQNCKGVNEKKFIFLLGRFLMFFGPSTFAVGLSVLAWIALYS